MNIAVINVPAFMTVVCVSAAGEGGHAGIEAQLAPVGNHSIGWAWKVAKLLPIGGVDMAAE